MANDQIIEIERRFIIDPLKLPLLPDGNVHQQGYLSYDPVIRVRYTAPDRCFFTIKGKGTISREEHEFELPRSATLSIIRLFKSPLILGQLTKKRYRLDRWEIDEFMGPHKGLWLAEIELEREDEKIEIPNWVVKEVTEDPRYSNAMLAKNGVPK